mmetsp:Transcript_16453/g.33090  ORF Transcript_16453/g.33090 Transcript_16453/m.33090 type:complete len:214 (-) Transcript_16453:151-792(-)
MSLGSSSGLCRGCPSTLTTMSPRWMPASCAGDPSSTEAISRGSARSRSKPTTMPIATMPMGTSAEVRCTTTVTPMKPSGTSGTALLLPGSLVGAATATPAPVAVTTPVATIAAVAALGTPSAAAAPTVGCGDAAFGSSGRRCGMSATTGRAWVAVAEVGTVAGTSAGAAGDGGRGGAAAGFWGRSSAAALDVSGGTQGASVSGRGRTSSCAVS